MFNKISVHFRPGDNSILPCLYEVVDYLLSKDRIVFLPQNDILLDNAYKDLCKEREECIAEADLAIVIGGDGTFLRTARSYAENNTPIFGINRGRLGFLTEFNPNEFEKHLEEVLKGNFKEARRMLLHCQHSRKETVIHERFFLNDAVLSRGSLSRAIFLELSIDDDFLNKYSGDGLIVATPTGSTAYSLSAGGPIIIPEATDSYLINPICPHSLAMRSMIIPASAKLTARVVSDYRNLLLTIDGQEAISIEGQDKICITRAQQTIRLITHPEKNYYAILREKLGWGSF